MIDDDTRTTHEVNADVETVAPLVVKQLALQQPNTGILPSTYFDGYPTFGHYFLSGMRRFYLEFFKLFGKNRLLKLSWPILLDILEIACLPLYLPGLLVFRRYCRKHGGINAENYSILGHSGSETGDF